MVYRKLPQRIAPGRSQVVLAAIMECRRAARSAAVGVLRDSAVDHALSGLVRAIDALAVYLTRLRREGDPIDVDMGDALRARERDNRPPVIQEPGLLLGELRACRIVMNGACADVAPLGATYEALQIVLAAIDALAMLLTGNRDYFHAPGSGATAGEAEREARKRAREQGEAI